MSREKCWLTPELEARDGTHGNLDVGPGAHDTLTPRAELFTVRGSVLAVMDPNGEVTLKRGARSGSAQGPFTRQEAHHFVRCCAQDLFFRVENLWAIKTDHPVSVELTQANEAEPISFRRTFDESSMQQ